MKIKIDYQICIYLFLLFIIGCFFIYSSSVLSGQYAGGINFVFKQIVFFILGFIGMIVISRFDITQLKNLSIIIYIILFILLIGLLVLPESIVRPINNAKAWYQIPLIGTFQPSEFFKFPLLILSCWIITNHIEKEIPNRLKSDLILFAKIAILSLPPMLLIYNQPDTGMILLYISMLLPLIFFSNVQKKILLLIIAIPTVFIGFITYTYFFSYEFFQKNILEKLSPHQISRINGWLNPFNYIDSAYQTTQGILAIGSGEIYGKGYLKNNVYIPEKHTDFIFANIAEETGFLGASIVIILFFLLIYRIVQISLKANTPISILLAVGIVSLFTFQVFQNIGMTLGLLPVTGVTLPFLSYGGSSLLSNMLLLGIIISIKNSHSNYMFTKDEEDGEEY